MLWIVSAVKMKTARLGPQKVGLLQSTDGSSGMAPNELASILWSTIGFRSCR